MRLVSFFSRSQRGAIAPMMAVSILVLVLVSGGAVEYSNFYRARDTLQKTADAAALAGARHFHENRDEAAARDLVNRVLETGQVKGYVTGLPPEISFSYDAEHHTTYVDLRVAATGPTTFMRLANIDELTARVESYAVKGGVKDIYVYMLLDVTGSMGTLIQAASAAMIDFEAQLRLRLEQQGLEMGRLFVKVGYFRDLRSDKPEGGGSLGWEESAVFDMSDALQRQQLSNDIRGRVARGGGDTPESSPAAIAHALTAPIEMPANGGAAPSRHMVQVIGVWTHVEGLPLGPADIAAYEAAGSSTLSPKVDDVTVPFYKNLLLSGSLGPFQQAMKDYARGLIEEHPEDSYHQAAQVTCCRSLEQLRTEWHSRGAVQLSNRYLALFVFPQQYPWREMARWENAMSFNYNVSSPDAFIDGVVQAVIESGMDLSITPPPTRPTR